MSKYGIFLGRFQPFHVGHEAIVHEIIADGLTPVVCIGSCNVQDEKNPYTPGQRYDMIQAVFPGIDVFTFNDYDSWEKWAEDLLGDLKYFGVADASVFYVNHKEVDKCSFTFKGTSYVDCYWSDIIEKEGYKVKFVTYPKKLGIDISARDIRKNLEENKHYLDSRVYNLIKGY